MKLKGYIDCENDATSELFTDTSHTNTSSQGMGSRLSNDDHIVETITNCSPEIEYSGIAEEIIIEDESNFKSSSPSSTENKSYEEDKNDQPTIGRKTYILDENSSSRHPIPDNFVAASPPEIISIDLVEDHTYQAATKKPTEPNQTATDDKISVIEATEAADKPYKCHICGKLFSRNSSLKCHIRLHVEGPDSMLRNTSATTSSGVNRVIDEDHVQNTYSCVICNRKFTQKNALKYHIQSHLNSDSKSNAADDDISGSDCNHDTDAAEGNDNGKREYRCIMCNKCFSRRSSLTFHYKFHPVDKSPSSKKQETETNDDEPMDVDDADSKRYKCPTCGKKFSRMSSLEWHLKSHENNVRKKSNDSEMSETHPNEYRCEICDKSFEFLKSLKEHMNCHKMLHNGDDQLVNGDSQLSDDNGTNTLKCHVCGQSFSRIRNLKLHMVVHKDTSSRPGISKDSSHSNFEKVSSHHKNYADISDVGKNNRFSNTCGICDKTFPESSSLRKHMSTFEHNAKNANSASIFIPGLYKCGVCEKAFDELESLTNHVTVHLRLRTFQCGICCQSLPSKDALKSHLLEHETKPSSGVTLSNDVQEEELSCVVCDRVFGNNNALKRHMNCHRKVEEEIVPRVSSSGRRIKDPRSRENDWVTYSSEKVVHKSSSTLPTKSVTDGSDDDTTNEEINRESVSCVSCSRIFRNNIALRSHLIRNVYCSQYKNSIATLPQNRTTPLDTEKDRNLDSLKCSCCDRLFTSITALRRHVSNHSKGVPDDPQDVEDEESSMAASDSLMNYIKCDRCDKFFTSIRSLKLHISEHTRNQIAKPDAPETRSDEYIEYTDDQQPKLFKCDICREKFADEEELDTHMTTSHDPPNNTLNEMENEFQCNRCNKVFSALKSLNIHKGRYCREDSVKDKNDKIIEEEVEEDDNEDDENDEEEGDSDTETTALRECCDKIFANVKAYEIHKARFCIKESDEPEDATGSLVCCNRTFANYRALHIHKYYHREEESLKCKCCGYIFANIKALKAHSALKMKRATDETHLRRCERCDKYFINAKTLSRHMAEHSEDDDSDADVFVSSRCNICGKIFKTNKALRVHQATHTDAMETQSSDDEDSFKCPKCDKVFETERSLRVHRAYHTKMERLEISQSEHPLYIELKAGRYKCNVCGKIFDTIKAANQHSSLHKTDSKNDATVVYPYPCTKCDRTFATGSGLGGHMVSHKQKKPSNGEEEDTEYPCLECDKTFATLEEVAEHKTVHENDTSDDEVAEVHPCPKCDRIFATRKGLGTHSKVHKYERTEEDDTEGAAESLEYQCPKCDRSFATVKGLAKHKTIHKDDDSDDDGDGDDTESVDADEYPCPKCDRSFTTAKGLAKHKTFHKDESGHENDAEFSDAAEYQCTMCDRSFSTPKGIAKHKSVHKYEASKQDDDADTDIDEYPCSKCDRSFSTVKGLAKHKTVHKDEDDEEEDDVESVESGEYGCGECDRRFHSLRGLSIHKSIHKGTDEPIYSCKKCHQTFLSDKGLAGHMKKHKRDHIRDKDGRPDDSVELGNTVEDEQSAGSKHRCDICQLTFHNVKSLSSHYSVHKTDDKDTPKRNEKGDFKELRISIHQCKMCDEAFTDHVSLRDHSMLHNSAKKDAEEETQSGIFECPDCPRIFNSIQGIRRHSSIHKGEKRKSKNHVDETIPMDESVEQIETVVHVNNSILDSTTSMVESSIERVDATMHSITDTATSANSTFVEPIQISLNLNEVEGTSTNREVKIEEPSTPEIPSLKCKICGRQFSTGKALKKHIMFHKFNDFAEETEINETNESHKCSLCGKMFQNEDDLEHHLTFHGTLPNGSIMKSIGPVLKCDWCEEIFTRIVSLKSHCEEVHDKTITDEITFKCEMCGEQFTKASAFMLHKKHHRILNNSSPTEGTMPFECISCEKCFRFKDDLLEHVKTHSDNELAVDSLALLVGKQDPTENETATEDDDILYERTVVTKQEHTSPYTELNENLVIMKVEPIESVNDIDPLEDYEIKIENPGVTVQENFVSHDNESNEDEPKENLVNDVDPLLEDFQLRVEDETKFPDTKITPVDGLYSCTYCEKTFSKSCHLGAHIRIHRRKIKVPPVTPLPSPTKQHECIVCGLKFRIKSTLALHYQSHSQDIRKKTLKRVNSLSDSAEEEGVRSKRRPLSRY